MDSSAGLVSWLLRARVSLVSALWGRPAEPGLAARVDGSWGDQPNRNKGGEKNVGGRGWE